MPARPPQRQTRQREAIQAAVADAGRPLSPAEILEAARRSLRGVGEEETPSEAPTARALPAGRIGSELVASLRRPEAIRQAVVLGAALTPYRRRRSGRYE